MNAELFGRVAFIVVFSAFSVMRIRFKRAYRVPSVAAIDAAEGWPFSLTKLVLTGVAAGATISYVATELAAGLPRTHGFGSREKKHCLRDSTEKPIAPTSKPPRGSFLGFVFED